MIKSQNLSKELPNEEDCTFLKELLAIQRTQGPEAITVYLKERLNEFEGD